MSVIVSENLPYSISPQISLIVDTIIVVVVAVSGAVVVSTIVVQTSSG